MSMKGYWKLSDPPSPLKTDVEMSFEANPGTIQDKDMSEYKRIGFNRVSLGVQSFNADELGLLGRIHNTQDVYDAVKIIRKAGFDNMNIDLIYGLPGQTMSSWIESLKELWICNRNTYRCIA